MSTATAGTAIIPDDVNAGKKNRLAARAKPTDFISHSPYLIEGLRFSSQEFYARVEKALADRQVPDLEVTRVDWKEGGPLSPRREYLRLTRERLVFDVCAAPFGTGFFVSLWHGEKPLKIELLEWCFLLAALLMVMIFLTQEPFGVYMWLRYDLGLSAMSTALVALALVATAVVLIAVRAGPALDNLLIRTPIVGYFYERFIRSITYWRVDRTCMYLTAVHNAVMQVMDEVSTAQGIAPLSESSRQPPIGELQRRLFGRPGRR